MAGIRSTFLRVGLPLAGLAVAGAIAAVLATMPGQEARVVEAATISGTVVYEGKAPRMRPIPNVDSDPQCAHLTSDEPLMTEFLILGEGQTVGNIFVQVVSGLPEGKKYAVPEDPVEITQKNCRYAPHVVVLRAGQPIKFVNPDGMQHNVHAMPEENREFNKAMAKTQLEVGHVFKEPEPMFRIKCDVHGWMEAFCAVVDHPFFAVTQADGKYVIDGLDPGEYEIEAWHEVMGTRRATVTVAEGEDAVADFTFTRPKR